MEPITALTVATATVQFIDFGLKTLNTCKQIRDSATNTTELHSELQQAIRQLENLQNGVTLDRYPQGTSRAVKDISRDCSQIAKEIHTLLKGIRNVAQTKRFGAFRAALLSIKEQKKIEKLQNKLEQCQSKFHTSVSVDMREQVLRILQAQNKMDKTLEGVVVPELRRMGVESTAGHQKTQNSMTLYHKQTLAAHDVAQKHLRALRTSSATAAEHQGRLRKEMQSCFEDVESSTQSRSMYDTFLRSLEYPEMFERHQAINPPAASTFEWIFTGEVPQDENRSEASISAEREERLKLSRWLSGSGFAFWINGKAGSGKSSLMSFIEGDERTLRLLQTWAGDCVLHIFSFFFWRPGSYLQKSIPGLLQSLLYQLVRAKPEVIKPVISAGLYSSGIIWTETKLLRVLQEALVHFREERIVFLIDGLDEFEGDYLKLLQTLLAFETRDGGSNVKLLLSSRPETVLFNDLCSFPSLRLQDLNARDIAQYVKNRIGDIAEQHEDLVKDLIDRAEGIFLWAVLVCDSIISGIAAKDTCGDLKRRLDATPSGLDRLFIHMFSCLDSIHRESVATYFCLLKWKATLGFDPTIGFITVLLRGQSFTSMQHFSSECEVSEHRVLAQTKGLIEVSKGWQWPNTHAWALRDIASGHVRTDFLKDKDFRIALDYSTMSLEWIHRSAYDTILGTLDTASGFILPPGEEYNLARRSLLTYEWIFKHCPILAISGLEIFPTVLLEQSVLTFFKFGDDALAAEVYHSLDRIHNCIISSIYGNVGAVDRQWAGEQIEEKLHMSLLEAFWESDLQNNHYLDYLALRFDWVKSYPDARALSVECLFGLFLNLRKLGRVPSLLEMHLRLLCDRAVSCRDRIPFFTPTYTGGIGMTSSFCDSHNDMETIMETILYAKKIEFALIPLRLHADPSSKDFDDVDAIAKLFAQAWALLDAWQLFSGSTSFVCESLLPLQILTPSLCFNRGFKSDEAYRERRCLRFICFNRDSCAGYDKSCHKAIAVVAYFDLSSQGSQELLCCLCRQERDELLRFSGTAEDQNRCLSLVQDEIWSSWDKNLGAWQQLYLLACVKKWFKDFWVTDEQARNFQNGIRG